MVNLDVFGYICIVITMIYRICKIPQIIKIYENKKKEEISTKNFVLRNCLYLFLVIYFSKNILIFKLIS